MLAAHNSGNLLKTNHVVDEIPAPKVGAHEVLIEVHASSVNPLDWKVYKGIRYLPFKKVVLGHDVAGVIAKVGSRVKDYKIGDEVFCCMPGLLGGAFAEQATVSEKNVARKPSNLTMPEAAAVPLASLTAWQAFKQTHLSAGKSVLIIGASGGVGTFAVQMAKSLGAEVTGVSGAANIELVKSLGADKTIDYTQESFRDQSTQYDVVFDIIGHESLQSCTNILKADGHYITTNPNPRSIMDIASHNLPFKKGQNASFISMKPNAHDLNEITALIEAGKIKPVIDKEYKLTEIDAAYTYSQLGHARGKIVINLRA